ncbi:MAG: hypothetical protein JNK35_04025 [Phycisphaerae bacterium]|nr:hypothetical protein [Phycisphaerae bacterium]
MTKAPKRGTRGQARAPKGGQGRGTSRARPKRAPGSRRAPAAPGAPAATPPGADQRLERIEEAATYTERSVEALTEQLLDVDRRMRQLAARLESLEGRLVRIAETAARAEAADQGVDDHRLEGGPGAG